MLRSGDLFPPLTFACAGGGEISLPGDLSGGFGVILFYRGAWSSACNLQLATFSRAASELASEGIKVVSVSVDGRETAEGLVGELNLPFPVAYGVDAREVSAVTGAPINEDPVFLEASGFVLNPAGRIETIIYSSSDHSEDRIVTTIESAGPIGRLMPDDVLRLVRHLKSSAM